MTIKSVQFVESDKKLIDAIKRYQKKNHIPNFTAAVRQLCSDALHMSEVISHNK